MYFHESTLCACCISHSVSLNPCYLSESSPTSFMNVIKPEKHMKGCRRFCTQHMVKASYKLLKVRSSGWTLVRDTGLCLVWSAVVRQGHVAQSRYLHTKDFRWPIFSKGVVTAATLSPMDFPSVCFSNEGMLCNSKPTYSHSAISSQHLIFKASTSFKIQGVLPEGPLTHVYHVSSPYLSCT